VFGRVRQHWGMPIAVRNETALFTGGHESLSTLAPWVRSIASFDLLLRWRPRHLADPRGRP
jgi:hypothetical protein